MEESTISLQHKGSMESKKGYSLVVGRDKENEQGEEI